MNIHRTCLTINYNDHVSHLFREICNRKYWNYFATVHFILTSIYVDITDYLFVSLLCQLVVIADPLCYSNCCKPLVSSLGTSDSDVTLVCFMQYTVCWIKLFVQNGFYKYTYIFSIYLVLFWYKILYLFKSIYISRNLLFLIQFFRWANHIFGWVGSTGCGMSHTIWDCGTLPAANARTAAVATGILELPRKWRRYQVPIPDRSLEQTFWYQKSDCRVYF